MKIVAILSLASVALAGCNLPGKPATEPEVPRPEAVVSFDRLYGQNCAGCHGADGSHGPATDLANPEYQAMVDDNTLRTVISNGVKGSLMPGFSLDSGGMLTPRQIDAIVRGMRDRWSRPNPFNGATPPPYRSAHPGNAAQGESVYNAACARCHGSTAQHAGPAGSILDGSFLALINEQTIRTTVIAGRPDIGEPDWRNHIPGRAMTDDEVTNVSAWLLAKRPIAPGQPYPNLELPGQGQPPAGQPAAVKH
ncbi:MAG TPA: c-type cytochrome [Terracidiphilus sp.]|jgi:cytochrome c oxidase cbb3-type subunit 3/ubiquinol-cytochrome c reductase cytochrome c subunit|nr:c-type cytochrome [Terracidiphilus sp.]